MSSLNNGCFASWRNGFMELCIAIHSTDSALVFQWLLAPSSSSKSLEIHIFDVLSRQRPRVRVPSSPPFFSSTSREGMGVLSEVVS